MKKTRFTEPQIMAVLREAESGVAVPAVCRTHGISTASFYIYGRLSRCKPFVDLCLPFSRVANIYPASPDSGAPKWEFRVVSLNKWSAS